MTASFESGSNWGDVRFYVGRPQSATFDRTLTRVFDVSVSVVALIFLMPLMILVVAAIWLFDPGPVFFAHPRVGRGNVMFPCLKFRSMKVDSAALLKQALEADPALREEWNRSQKLKNDPRITLIGKFLRKSSIDELPQLINVLRGEMSLVGPRPITPSEIQHYGRYFDFYCRVQPGITGFWQISGRSDVSYRRRVAFDVTYVRTKTLRLNIAIILKTVPAILMAKGSY